MAANSIFALVVEESQWASQSQTHKLISYERHLCYILCDGGQKIEGMENPPPLPLIAFALKSAVDYTGTSHIIAVLSHHIENMWRQSGGENSNDWSKLVFHSLLALLESLPRSLR